MVLRASAISGVNLLASPFTNDDRCVADSGDERIRKLGGEGEHPLPPRFFSAGSYEFEVSVSCGGEEVRDGVSRRERSLNSGREMAVSDRMVVDPRPAPSPSARKTVYLIRHAESDENRRQASLRRSFRALSEGALPRREDMEASVELLDLTAQLDSGVSPRGRDQIRQLGKKLWRDDFLRQRGVQLVAHSPLERARQTCKGMLGCVALRDKENSKPQHRHQMSFLGASRSLDEGNLNRANTLITFPENQHLSDRVRVVELACLSERTPIEWLPGPTNHDVFTSRIASFERWLADQRETVIAVVGHSHYFKSMLGLEKKFQNCDVWKVDFDASISVEHAQVKRDVIKSDRYQRAKKMQREREKIKREINQHKERLRREIENHREKIEKEVKESQQRIKQMISGPSLDQLESGTEEHDDGIENISLSNLPTDDSSDYGSGEFVDDPDDVSSEFIAQDELPRGWSGLVNLYSYNPQENENDGDHNETLMTPGAMIGYDSDHLLGQSLSV